MSTRVVTTHLPEQLADELDGFANRLDRSRAWIVKQALSDWIEWEREKDRRTLAALEDVRAGHVVDHEEVAAWAGSLFTDNPLPRPKAK